MRTLQIGEKTVDGATKFAVVELKEGVVVATVGEWRGLKSDAMRDQERLESFDREQDIKEAKRQEIFGKYRITRDALAAEINRRIGEAGVKIENAKPREFGNPSDSVRFLLEHDVEITVKQEFARGYVRGHHTENAEIEIENRNWPRHRVTFRVLRDGTYNVKGAVKNALERVQSAKAKNQYEQERIAARDEEARLQSEMLKKDFGLDTWPKLVKMHFNKHDNTWSCEMPHRSTLTAQQIKQILNAIDPETYKL